MTPLTVCLPRCSTWLVEVHQALAKLQLAIHDKGRVFQAAGDRADALTLGHSLRRSLQPFAQAPAPKSGAGCTVSRGASRGRHSTECVPQVEHGGRKPRK